MNKANMLALVIAQLKSWPVMGSHDDRPAMGNGWSWTIIAPNGNQEYALYNNATCEQIELSDYDPSLQVGDIVRPIDAARQLRSGCSAYGAAVVVSVEPFVMVSEHADMRWSCESATDYKCVGVAIDELLQLCMTRLDS